jgi:hypothetical protein
MIELDQSVLIWLVVITALLSSITTLVLLLLLYKFKIGPEIENHVEGQLKKSVSVIEESIRRRMVEAVTVKSEFLAVRAKGLAKSGMNLFNPGGLGRNDDQD